MFVAHGNKLPRSLAEVLIDKTAHFIEKSDEHVDIEQGAHQ